MAERPLLILPTPEPIKPPRGGGGAGPLRKPSRDSQVGRFQPVFQRLRQALDGGTAGVMELRDDPSSLAPDRVIVFDIAGNVSDFVKAIAKVPGLEFMAEYETEEPPNELFAVEDTRPGREGAVREDKTVPGRFYLADADGGRFRGAVEPVAAVGARRKARQGLHAIWARLQPAPGLEALGRGGPNPR